MNAKFLGLAVMGALAAAAPANALTYVQDVNVDNRFGGYFNPFDSALGTLSRVTVEATVSDQRGAAVQLWSPGYSGQAQISVTGAVGTTLTGLIDYSGSSLVTFSSAQPYLTAVGTGSGLFEYSGDQLSMFFGSGPKFISVDEARLASVSYVLPSDFFGSLYEMTNPAGISIAHRITYEYSAPGEGPPNVETPVPEPASWAMMIIGFGVVGHALRRARRSRGLAQAA